MQAGCFIPLLSMVGPIALGTSYCGKKGRPALGAHSHCRVGAEQLYSRLHRLWAWACRAVHLRSAYDRL